MGNWLQMDWLEDLYEKIKRYIKRVSLKKAMCIYIFIALICVFFLWLITVSVCNGWQNLILDKYGIDFKNFVSVDYLNIEAGDKWLLKIIIFIRNYSIFIYSMAAIVITSQFYYNNKIKEPLKILKTEADYVSRGDLSFECRYESNDEMAVICKTFNDMRLKLIENNSAMWKLIEEQADLNAVMAHDLRNPLSIIEGYNEMLIKYMPEGKISEEKLMSTLKLMNTQIIRMKEFLNRIKSIRSFSEMRVCKKREDIKILIDGLKEMIEGFDKGDIDILLEDFQENREGFYDLSIIEEVVGNLLSNAVRFAKKEVKISLKVEGDKLLIFVKDDGRGFSKKELFKASDPFYTSEKKDSSHFGIGLNICKILTEKHGGSLSLSNSIDGGAIVCGEFQI